MGKHKRRLVPSYSFWGGWGPWMATKPGNRGEGPPTRAAHYQRNRAVRRAKISARRAAAMRKAFEACR